MEKDVKDVKIQWCMYGDHEQSDPLETRDQCRQSSKAYPNSSLKITTEVKASNEQSSWASDRSMQLLASGILESKTITCTIIGPQAIAM